MLKHILTGQPASAVGQKHHSNDYQTQGQQAHQQTPVGVSSQTSGAVVSHNHAHHHHNHQSYNHHPSHPDHQLNHHHHHQHFTVATSANRIARNTPSNDVYDSVLHLSQRNVLGNNSQSHQPTPSSTHRHPLNHSQLSVNNLSQRFNNPNNNNNSHHAFNLSMLSTSKHSVNSASPIVGNNNNITANNNNCQSTNSNHTNGHHGNGHHHSIMTNLPQERIQANGGLEISRISRLPSQATPSPAPLHPPVGQQILPAGPIVQLNTSWSSTNSKNNRLSALPPQQEAGVKEMLTFLGLLCLVSLLLAMLSHIFLLKISPLTVTPSSLISPEEYTIVYEVTLALCALALSLNLCCLLVCAIQFLFAVKLVKSSYQAHRTNKYLQKSSLSRVCAVGGFFISIPVFLTGMILYTFIQFHSTPAIVMSVFIGLGIVFCGCAMVHNVFVWQREKTNAVKALARAQCEAAAQLQRQQLQQQQQAGGGARQATPNRVGQKIGALTAAHSTTTLQNARSSAAATAAYQQQMSNHHHHHHPQHHRHIQMSPPLLISSPSALTATHATSASHQIIATPPTTPGDRSPPSPTNNKHNRSQSHLQQGDASGSISPGLPAATLDLSSAATTNSPHELSTLV